MRESALTALTSNKYSQAIADDEPKAIVCTTPSAVTYLKQHIFSC
ncbi:MAG: hypothetical protein RM338_17910 [Nostoc sp. DedQUE12a]|nr:hypothetical protein [Nostoc sp. DedQUE12a]